MSKCWYCNNELTSGDNPKHLGICNKCYDEMFKSGDAIIRSLTNKIAELQKQLEEKEKIIQMQQNIKRYDIGEILTENVKLKQQLHSQPAEIVEKIKDLAGDYFYENGEEDLLLTGGDFTEILDTVLKEYQK